MDSVSAGQKLARRLALLVARSRGRLDGTVDESATGQLSELARACASTQPAITEEALATLTENTEPGTRAAAVQGLQHLLLRLPGLSRIELVSRWVSSDGSRRRTAIAHALHSDLYVLGAASALDCLANDDAPAVRAAAYGAAAFRVEAGGDELAHVLWRGARDRDSDARASAVVGVQRLARHGTGLVRSEARRLLGAI